MLDYYYQDEAVDAMLQCKNNGVVVLPTGSGKSHVIQKFADRFPGKILIVSHVKEILEQNFSKLNGDIGLYSAGLNVRHIARVTVASIQTIYRQTDLFRDTDVVLIDECHMVNDEGMYKTLLDRLGCQYMGLTASPYRLKQGYIYTNDGMFDGVIYEAPVAKLTREGYLCKLIPYGSSQEFDTSSIATTGGDFNLKDMSLAFDRDEMSRKIVQQLVEYKDKCKHWLIFCIDIKHAEAVSKLVNDIGVSCEAVHSESPRDETLQKFKAGEIQAVTNVNVLTVGFDFPEIDLLVILRPTKSPTLHIQMQGRGARIAPGKSHCIVKDFAGNIKRLGTLSSIQVDDKGKLKKKGKGDMPFLKECPECEKLNAPATRMCECGHKFQFKHNLNLHSHAEKAPPKWYDVDGVLYKVHRKQNSPPCVRVDYICSMRVFSEWVLLEHSGYARHKANAWLKNRWRSSDPVPNTALELHKSSNNLWKPSRIKVEENGKYPNIIQVI